MKYEVAKPKEGECPVYIYHNFDGKYCRRPVKRNSKCGIHAAAEERVAANERKRAAEAEADRLRRVETDKRRSLANNLAMMLGNKLGVAMQGDHYRGAFVSMDLETAEILLKRFDL